MVTSPRWRDPAWWRTVGDDLRPRLLVLHVRADGVHLRWAVPVWALQESLRAVLLVTPWLLWVARCAPAEWRRTWHGRTAGFDWDLRGPAGRPPWVAGRALLEGDGADAFALPAGEPFVRVETDDATVDLRPW